MKKRLFSIFIFILYSVFLIKVMVFKDVPLIRIGTLMLNFGGTDAGHPANFIPFRTIIPYLFGFKGLIIAGINLVGNVALLVPIGFLISFVYRNITWKKCLALAFPAGFVIEIMQVVLRVGIFDIDDVILNALGVMIGYWAFVVLAQWVREKKYKTIVVAVVLIIAAAAAAFYVVYPWGSEPAASRAGAGGIQPDRSGNEQEGEIPESGDLCGGTGGVGEIVSMGNNTVTVKRKDGNPLIVNFTNQTTITTQAGPVSQSNLKIGERITIVGDPASDGSFNATDVVVCNGAGPE